MSDDTIYCYHCQRRHPKEEMRRLETKTGTRWRCIASINAAKQSREAREAYGKQMTEANKAEAQSKARIILHAGR